MGTLPWRYAQGKRGAKTLWNQLGCKARAITGPRILVPTWLVGTRPYQLIKYVGLSMLAISATYVVETKVCQDFWEQRHHNQLGQWEELNTESTLRRSKASMKRGHSNRRNCMRKGTGTGNCEVWSWNGEEFSLEWVERWMVFQVLVAVWQTIPKHKSLNQQQSFILLLNLQFSFVPLSNNWGLGIYFQDGSPHGWRVGCSYLFFFTWASIV